MEIRPLGDSAVVLVYKNTGYGQITDVIRRDYNRIRRWHCPGITDVVLCFTSIGIYFDQDLITYRELHRKFSSMLFSNHQEISDLVEESRLISIPVNYGGVYGPDLDKAASMLNLTPEQVVKEHLGTTYNVYGLGFLPGFPYMGDLPDTLVLPRKSVPDPAVRPGSVAIAGKQTGIYPFNSPGGWYVIGWTPLKMFDLERPDSCLVKTGDKVRFTLI